MCFGLMMLSITIRVFATEAKPEIREPTIVLSGLAHPNCAWVIGVRLAIGVCRDVVGIYDPVCAVQKLSGFKNHLDDMLVAMILGGFAGVQRKYEDIHGGRSSLL
jgi:hypothetical protein